MGILLGCKFSMFQWQLEDFPTPTSNNPTMAGDVTLGILRLNRECCVVVLLQKRKDRNRVPALRRIENLCMIDR